MTAKSDQDGRFEFDSVPAGRYAALEEGELTGYIKWGEKAGVKLSERTIVVRTGQPSPPLLIHLNAGAIIQGRATGPDGQPVAGLRVSALRSETLDGVSRILARGGDTTLQDGTYQIRGLAAGSCLLAADVKRQVKNDETESEEIPPDGGAKHLVRTFYPSTLSASSAGQIKIISEQVISDLNIQMQSGSAYSIRGVVVSVAAGHGYKVYVGRKTDVSSLRMIRVTEGGSFSIGGLPPGTYGLELLDTTPGLRRGPAVLAYADVEVKADDVEGVSLVIKPSPGRRIRGGYLCRSIPLRSERRSMNGAESKSVMRLASSMSNATAV